VSTSNAAVRPIEGIPITRTHRNITASSLRRNPLVSFHDRPRAAVALGGDSMTTTTLASISPDSAMIPGMMRSRSPRPIRRELRSETTTSRPTMPSAREIAPIAVSVRPR
jgi:hypothetical protein